MLDILSLTVKYETICIQVIAESTSVSNNNYFLIPECFGYFIFLNRKYQQMYNQALDMS